MNIFKNKILVKIIASICIILTIMNTGLTNTVYAEGYGGILLNPVTKLLTSIADGVLSLLHKTVQHQDLTFVEISGAWEWWDSWGEKAVAIIVTCVVIAVAVHIGLGALAGAGLIKIAAIGAGVVLAEVSIKAKTGESAAVYAGKFVAERITDLFSETLYMPVFTITPQHIFSNKIWLFDINFFEPESEKNYHLEVNNASNLSGIVINSSEKSVDVNGIEGSYKGLGAILGEHKNNQTDININSNMDKILYDFIISANGKLEEAYRPTISIDDKYKVRVDDITEATSGIKGTGNYTRNKKIKVTVIDIEKDKAYISITHTVKETEKKVGGYHAERLESQFKENFKVKIENDVSEEMKIEATKITTIATTLKSTISKWYFILRNLAILMLLILLIYIGIRIVIASTAGQKAKYKERLQDWLVAMCLLFIMHYIMVFATNLTEEFTDLISSLKNESGAIAVVPLKQEHIQNINDMQEEETSPEYTALKSLGTVLDAPGGGKELAWITDYMGKFKIMTQATEDGTARWVGYSICYIILVVFTIFFAWTYLKRVVYMAFLTMIAPMVAMTYPLDKLNDGKAQAFSMWLKEYIFNLLIQPMHLLLYTILISSAYKLAATNVIYAIVALGFITPAEALVRKFFGFTKAQTPGMVSGAAGAALAYTGLQSVIKFSKGLTGGKEKQDEKEYKEPRWTSKDKVDPHKSMANNMLKDKNEPPKSEGQGIRTEGGPEVAPDVAPDVAQKAVPETAPETVPETAPETAPDGAPETATEGAPKAASETAPEGAPKAAPDTNPTQTNKPRYLTRAIKTGAKGYFRRIGNKWRRRIQKQKPIRALARGVTGITTGAALGMAGVALGIASGDPSKAFKYGTTAAIGGYHVGKGIAGKTVNALSVDTKKLSEEIELASYGGDVKAYKEAKIQQGVLKQATDDGNIWKLQQLLPEMERKEIVEAMKGDFGRACFENNITDMEDVAALYKASNYIDPETGQPAMDLDTAIAGLKFNSYLPAKLKNMDEDDRDQMIRRWVREYEELKATDPRYKDIDPEKAAKDSWKAMEQINKIRSDLKDATP